MAIAIPIIESTTVLSDNHYVYTYTIVIYAGTGNGTANATASSCGNKDMLIVHNCIHD